MRENRMVGLAGFEPTTSSPPVKRATKLRYSPSFSDWLQVAGVCPPPPGEIMCSKDECKNNLEPVLA